MFNLCTEFIVSGMSSVSFVSCVVLLYLLFISNIFVTSESMYIVMMIEKKLQYTQFFPDKDWCFEMTSVTKQITVV